MTTLAKLLVDRDAHFHWNEKRKSWFLSFSDGKRRVWYSKEFDAVSKAYAEVAAREYLERMK